MKKFIRIFVVLVFISVNGFFALWQEAKYSRGTLSMIRIYLGIEVQTSFIGLAIRNHLMSKRLKAGGFASNVDSFDVNEKVEERIVIINEALKGFGIERKWKSTPPNPEIKKFKEMIRNGEINDPKEFLELIDFMKESQEIQILAFDLEALEDNPNFPKLNQGSTVKGTFRHEHLEFLQNIDAIKGMLKETLRDDIIT